MKYLENMTRDERSLLLFLETRAVDHGGLVDVKHMSSEDMKIAEKWTDEGFLSFGRVCSADIQNSVSKCTHWVELSGVAFTLAHAERFARAKRMREKRTWEKTAEIQDEVLEYRKTKVRIADAGGDLESPQSLSAAFN